MRLPRRVGAGRLAGKVLELLQEDSDLAHHNWVARRAGDCLVGQINELGSMEGRGQTLQSHGSHGPVAVATGSPKQVELSGDAAAERYPQLGQQGRVVTRCSGKRGIKGTVVEKHRPNGLTQVGLRRGLSSGATW